MEEMKQDASSIANPAIDSALDDLECPCLESDLVVLSHLRWDFVFQRPQHLMTRYARHRRVFFVEEPIWAEIEAPRLDISKRENNLHVVTPHLPHGVDAIEMQRRLLDDMIATLRVERYTLWYYTPMALAFTRHLDPDRILFDCMDELSAFKNAPRELLDMEKELLQLADVVYTGGHSLYEAKKDRHANAHPFPSSIDFDHFAKARDTQLADPADQAKIPHPRIGFFGVVDERFDIELLRETAKLRPDWHYVIIGPVVKIDPAHLPKADNIHYLGMKSYQELPAYLAHWDLAMLPFALNESTRYISPTKTPEYLAAGRPVVSTAIRDVIRPYGERGLVHIVDGAQTFVKSAELAMAERKTDPFWLKRVDKFLASSSWDQTWAEMARLEAEIESLVVQLEVQSSESTTAASVH